MKSCQGSQGFVLKREPRTHLNFPSRGRSFCDGAKLRCVYKAIGCAQVGVVKRVEKLGAELEAHGLRKEEVANHRDIQRLHSRPVYRVTASIAEGKGRRGSKCGCTEPGPCRVCARGEDGPGGGIGANRV